METRIIMLADTYNAMTTHRVYKKSITNDAALYELQMLKKLYDPNLVSALSKVVKAQHGT